MCKQAVPSIPFWEPLAGIRQSWCAWAAPGRENAKGQISSTPICVYVSVFRLDIGQKKLSLSACAPPQSSRFPIFEMQIWPVMQICKYTSFVLLNIFWSLQTRKVLYDKCFKGHDVWEQLIKIADSGW
jgi:hypothetical protein